MKRISDLIADLQRAMREHGDIPVHVYDDWSDFPYGETEVVAAPESDNTEYMTKYPAPRAVIYRATATPQQPPSPSSGAESRQS